MRRLASCLLLLLATPALADVYVLDDGDRISGKTLGVEGGIYKVQSAYGKLAIPRGRLLKIVHDDGREEVLDAAAAAAAVAPPPAPPTGPELVLLVSGASFWQAWSTKDSAFDPTLRFEVSLDENELATYKDTTPEPDIPGALMNAFGFDAHTVTAAAEGIGVAAPDARPGRITLRLQLPQDRAGERKLRVAYFGADAIGAVHELASNSIYVEIKPDAPTFVRVKQDAGKMDFTGFPKKKMKGLETFRIEMGME